MDRTDFHVLSVACHWAKEGKRFALVTVARTWGSSPRPAGSWLVLREDGLVEGSVSGGCIEDDLISRMHEGRLQAEDSLLPFKLVYGLTQQEATRYGLPCGGAIELVIEPVPVLLEDLAARLAKRQLVKRQVNLNTGKVTLEDALHDEKLQWDGIQLTTLHGAQRRLLIIGAGMISRYLAHMAQALDYDVTICDPRKEYSQQWDIPNTRFVTTMPDDTLLEMEPDERLAVVALTHDPKLDDMVLLEALKSPAFYVGAIGSKLNNSKRCQRLAEYFDLTQEELARLHGPVGLPIGSRTPPEIAVAILAEMTAVKNGVKFIRNMVSTSQSNLDSPVCASVL